MDNRVFEAEMARGFYGYGRWDAPYWFVGPEQGIGPKGVGNAVRAEAWHRLGSPEICDCKEFHFEIGEDSWYRTSPPPAPPLQSTWRPLMLLLMSFLGEHPDQDSVMLRNYQKEHWGRIIEGETCVIELSGLAARNSGEVVDRESFRPERLEVIRDRMARHTPRLVVFYGLKEKTKYEQIAGRRLFPNKPEKVESRTLVLVRHPVAPGEGNAYWTDLGRAAREAR